MHVCLVHAMILIWHCSQTAVSSLPLLTITAVSALVSTIIHVSASFAEFQSVWFWECNFSTNFLM